MQFVEPLPVFIHLHLEIRVRSSERWLRVFAQPFKFDGVSKHHVAVRQHSAKCFPWIRTLVFPEVFAIVDVEAYCNANLVGNVQCLKGSLGSMRGYGSRDT